jgi:2-oxoglutarate dehydrogenase E1 component
LYHARTAAKIKDITLIRLEQIAPFPYDLIGPAIRKFHDAELCWVQEEPKNMGAWSYVKPRFDTTCREECSCDPPFPMKSIRYIGRRPSASSATGGYKQHVKEQKEFLEEALS